MLLSWSVPGIRSNKLFTLLARNPGFLGCVSCSVPLLLVLPVGTATACCSLHLASAQGWVLKRKRTKKEGRVGLWGGWSLGRVENESLRPVCPPLPPSHPGRASSCSGYPLQHPTRPMPTACAMLLPTSISNICLVFHYGLAQGPRSLHDTACGGKEIPSTGTRPCPQQPLCSNCQKITSQGWQVFGQQNTNPPTIKGLN